MHPIRALFVAWPLSIAGVAGLAGVAHAAQDASAPRPVEHVVAPTQTVTPRGPPPTEPPIRPAAAPSKPSSSRSSAGDMGAFAAQLGLRGMLQHVSGTDRDGTLGGAGFGGWLFANLGVGALYLVGEEGQRKLGTAPHLGGRATLGLRPLVATVTWRHLFEGQNEPATPLDSVDGGLCLVFAKVAGVAVCVDGRVFKGTVGYPNGSFADSTVLYGGISLSLGAVVAGGGNDMDFKK